MKAIVTIGIQLFLCIYSYSQRDSIVHFKDLFTEAEYFFLDEEYASALPMYKKLFELDTANCNLAFRLGECYYHEKFFFQAINYLEIAKQRMDKKYKEGSCKETNASYKTLFLLAKSYQTIREYDKATRYYNDFINILDEKNVYDYDIAYSQLEACKRAREMVVNPVFVEIENIGPRINSPYNEINPVVSENDSLLIFSRKSFKETKFREDAFFVQQFEIYSTRRVNGIYSSPVDITRELSSDGFFLPVSLSANGKILVLFRDNYNNGEFDDEDEGALYYSEFKVNRWTKVKKFGSQINSSKWESSAFISNDGKTLYFSSDRKGGAGALDLYVSTKKNGIWSEPVNLGEAINTSFNEDMPFLIGDSLLYFTSEKHDNMGGYDIFISKKINEAWTEPVNIGYPINSSGNDIMLCPVLGGKKAYFSSYRPDGYFSFGKTDIYAVSFTKENQIIDILTLQLERKRKDSLLVYASEGQIQEKSTTIQGSVIASNFSDIENNVKVNLINISNKETVASVTAQRETQKYEMSARPGDYKLVVESENYTTKEQQIHIPSTNTSSIKVESAIEHENESGGNYFLIKPVFFEYGSYSLTQDAKFDLRRLSLLMKENPSLYLEVIGHTDSVSSYSFNKNLSLNRANSVISYLINQGVDASRFIQKGLSFDENIATNSSEEGRKFNRRVEMKIIKSDNDKVKVQDITVPDYLKNKSLLRFLVFIETTNGELKPNRYSSLGITHTETISNKGRMLVYASGFTKKSEAMLVLNNLLNKGFNNAEIIDNFTFQSNKKNLEQKQYSGKYTIQLLALFKPCTISTTFPSVEVTEHSCADGYYRYTFGTYNSAEEASMAQQEISKVWNYGSFIVPLEKFEDRKEKTVSDSYKYTIQLYALRKPLSPENTNLVNGCQEHYGNDGYYRYIYGKYSSIADAEKDQAWLAEQGFPSTFITFLSKFE